MRGQALLKRDGQGVGVGRAFWVARAASAKALGQNRPGL